jgi:hypothetical protein
MGQAMGARMMQSGGLLFGRRTCEDLLTYGSPPTRLRLVDSLTTTAGVVIGAYQAAGRAETRGG